MSNLILDKVEEIQLLLAIERRIFDLENRSSFLSGENYTLCRGWIDVLTRVQDRMQNHGN